MESQKEERKHGMGEMVELLQDDYDRAHPTARSEGVFGPSENDGAGL